MRNFGRTLLLVGLLAVASGTEGSTEPASQGSPLDSLCQGRDLSRSTEVDDYLAFAASCSPRLQAAHARWQASLERIKQVDVLPEPRVHVGHFIESVETRVGPQENRLGVTQGVPWLTKLRLRKDVAVEESRVAEQTLDAVRLKLFFEVKSAYYELYYLARAIAITEDNIALLLHLESVAQANFTVGAPVSGVVKAQVELGKLDDRLRTLQDLRGPATARLNATLGRSSSAPLGWPEELFPVEVQFDDQEVLASLAVSNPDLLALDYEVDRRAKTIDLARTRFRPDFALGLDWVDTRGATNPALIDSGKDPLVVKVSVTVPIWRSKYRAGVREAERRRQAARRVRNDAGLNLESRLELVLFAFHDAERKIDLFRDTLLPLAEASLEVAQQGYEAGEEGFLDVIDAQRQLLELQLSLERSLADREQRLAEIEMLAGRSFTPKSAQGGSP